jgi:hypothetical protein
MKATDRTPEQIDAWGRWVTRWNARPVNDGRNRWEIVDTSDNCMEALETLRAAGLFGIVSAMRRETVRFGAWKLVVDFEPEGE